MNGNVLDLVQLSAWETESEPLGQNSSSPLSALLQVGIIISKPQESLCNTRMSTVYGLVWPGSVTSGAEGFFFLQNPRLWKREEGDPPQKKNN